MKKAEDFRKAFGPADAGFRTVMQKTIEGLKAEEEKKAKEKLLDMGATILVKPLKQSAFTTAIQAADMAHIRLGALKKKLDDEKVITRAKLLLMQTLSFTEEEAHKFIEKEAMNSGRTRSDVAYEIIRTYESGK